MKKVCLIATLIIFCFLIIGTINSYAQTITNTYYNVKAGQNYGLKFWSSNAYKIHMTNSASISHYGPVNSYNIRSTMSNHGGRGFTWGIYGQSPSTALSNTGHFQTKGWIKTENSLFVGQQILLKKVTKTTASKN